MFSGNIIDFTNNRFTVNAQGDLYTRHMNGQSAAPVANVCPGFILQWGADTQGKATMTSGTSCSITFGNAPFSNAPACVVSPGTTASTVQVTSLSTGFNITFGTAQTSFSWVCLGV